MLLKFKLYACLSLIILNQAFSQDTTLYHNIQKEIKDLYMDFKKEKFIEKYNSVMASGWLMELPSGAKVTRSFLVDQADTLITYGREAVPYLVNWIFDDQPYIRFIAIYTLQQITGLKPHTPYFDQEDKEGNRKAAAKIWMEWYEIQKNKIE